MEPHRLSLWSLTLITPLIGPGLTNESAKGIVSIFLLLIVLTLLRRPWSYGLLIHLSIIVIVASGLYGYLDPELKGL
jgi:hypothetical protein